MTTTVELPVAPSWATLTYEDAGDICHDHVLDGAMLHRRDVVVGATFAAGDVEIIATGGEYFNPAEARKLAAVLVKAADLADQG